MIVSFEEKAMNPNRTAITTMTSAYTLDDIANMLEESLAPSNIIKSYDGFWYFRFDRVNGLEPVIELEELKDKFTILFPFLFKFFFQFCDTFLNFINIILI